MSAMISLGNPHQPLSRRLLEGDGFLWWYVDHIDEDKNGFVLIWSFGLPFLPKRRIKDGNSVDLTPRARPSLNLALYEDGRESFYLLEEFRADQASWSPDLGTWRFGRSTIRTLGGKPESEDDASPRRLSIALDLDVPGAAQRLTGQIALSGRPVELSADPEPAAHHWNPMLASASVEAALELDGHAYRRFSGGAYHDRNAGRGPLEALGIHRWTWGRVVLGERTLIYYLLEPEAGARPEAWVVSLTPEGDVVERDVPFEIHGRRRARFGMHFWPQVTIHSQHGPLRVTSEAPIDDGPFYLRNPIVCDTPFGRAVGLSEWVHPTRIHKPAFRPFVEMRVRQAQRRDSMWLPLFTGPREDRVRRLLSRRSDS